VVLNGSAYDPRGIAAKGVEVGLRVGSMSKSFAVVGNRVWEAGWLGICASRPQPFVKLPISYDVAFGGVDKSHPNEKKHKAFLENPAGRGFHSNFAKAAVHGKPLSNTEEVGQTVRQPDGKYRAMSFGPIGRAWPPRPKFAGTYDQAWLDNVFPFLPQDFDERYYQCAPPDQQMDYARGGEDVVLLNLTPEGRVDFKLPTVSVPIAFYRRNEPELVVEAVADTVIIEPDLNRLMMVWRAALPLKKNMFEVAQVVAGRMPPAWYRARELGKTWYPSLKELVDERRAEQRAATPDEETSMAANEMAP
jgi:hypothetical protein